MKMQEPRSLSWMIRWYIYAIHGAVCEIIFTSTWDIFAKKNLKLIGFSSIWAIFIYGTAILIIEKMSFHLKRNCPLIARCLVYTLWTYIWEFSTGYVLRTFDACPWDYSHFSGNIMGLITLEYAIPWYFGCMIAEQVVIKYTLKLQLPEDGSHRKYKGV